MRMHAKYPKKSSMAEIEGAPTAQESRGRRPELGFTTALSAESEAYPKGPDDRIGKRLLLTSIRVSVPFLASGNGQRIFNVLLGRGIAYWWPGKDLIKSMSRITNAARRREWTGSP